MILTSCKSYLSSMLWEEVSPVLMGLRRNCQKTRVHETVRTTSAPALQVRFISVGNLWKK